MIEEKMNKVKIPKGNNVMPTYKAGEAFPKD